jgi:hypothetical protein
MIKTKSFLRIILKKPTYKWYEKKKTMKNSSEFSPKASLLLKKNPKIHKPSLIKQNFLRQTKNLPLFAKISMNLAITRCSAWTLLWTTNLMIFTILNTSGLWRSREISIQGSPTLNQSKKEIFPMRNGLST